MWWSISSIQGRWSSGKGWKKALSVLWNGRWLFHTILLARTNLSLIISGSKWPSLKCSSDLGKTCLAERPLKAAIFSWRIFFVNDSSLSPPTRTRVSAVVFKMSWGRFNQPSCETKLERFLYLYMLRLNRWGPDSLVSGRVLRNRINFI